MKNKEKVKLDINPQEKVCNLSGLELCERNLYLRYKYLR